jgi:hypothetical protein
MGSKTPMKSSVERVDAFKRWRAGVQFTREVGVEQAAKMWPEGSWRTISRRGRVVKLFSEQGEFRHTFTGRKLVQDLAVVVVDSLDVPAQQADSIEDVLEMGLVHASNQSGQKGYNAQESRHAEYVVSVMLSIV